jgi:hypothetical protein
MLDRSCLSALLVVGLILPIAGCGKSQVDSLAVTPATQSIAVGQTANFTATGTFNHGSHPATTQDETSESSWVSSNPGVATVESPGVVLAKSSGTATITASIAGYTGELSSSALLTVTGAGGAGSDIVSINVIPGTQSVATPNQTSQFLAIGVTSAGTTVNLNGTVAWYSSDSAVASINGSTGLAQGASQGTTTITAIANNADNTVATGEAILTVLSGAQEQITSLSIIPGSESLSAEGQTSQLIAIGTSGTTGLQTDVTNITTPSTTTGYLTWGSSTPSIATICNNDLPVTNPVTCTATTNGLVTGQSVGFTTITAYWTNEPGNTVVTATPVTITTTSSPAPEPLLSLTVVPSSLTVANLQDTGNFLAIGTFSSAPYVRDLTNTVTWLSSFPNIFPVSSDNGIPNPGAPGGIVTAYGNGSTTIVAEATNADGSVQTQTAAFSCPLVVPCPCSVENGCSPAVTSCPNGPVLGSCFPGSQASGLLVTLTVYNEGLNTKNWLITAPSATGTADVLHCGPGWALGGGIGGSVCTATYPLGTTVTLTATQPTATTGTFGGWSSSCTTITPDPSTAAGPNTCKVSLGTVGNSNVTVGAIFN